MLISTSYLPPVWYFNLLAQTRSITLEACEHFVKQTIRNRCHIRAPNGVQALVIPVEHTGNNRVPVREVRIAGSHSWQRQHWRSLEAAYRRSAYFEFYQDDLAPFYHKPYSHLLEFNTGLLQLLLRLIGLEKPVAYTETYVEEGIENDFRQYCDTGQPRVGGMFIDYPQVFGYKNGFIPGLSMADLLFNMGPASAGYLASVVPGEPL